MKPLQPQQSMSKRAALEDGMARVNTLQGGDTSRPPMIHHESRKAEGQVPVSDVRQDTENRRPPRNTETVHPQAQQANERKAALLALEGKKHSSNRDSVYSMASTNASEPGGRRERKTHIGPWNLGKTLGKGATARVRLARHNITGAHAAVKIVQKNNSAMTASGSLATLARADAVNCGPNSRRMPYGIEREVAIMKLMKHPNILNLQDIWENRSEIYLVLEYADNGELFEHIVNSKSLSEAETMKYFRQMLSAIAYCHQFNICHRDLKPENILLTEDMNIRIADFGMAALQQSEDHRLATSCGSPHYAAPEVILGNPYKGDKIDVWSLGVILYACLCGRLPFDNDDIPTLLKSIRKGKYTLPPHISQDARDLISRILVVDPHKRLSIRQIWKHPLVKKYEHLDNFDEGRLYGQLALRQLDPNLRKRSDIDTELFRSIRSLWHKWSEEDLIDALLDDKRNEQKSFYALFAEHRRQQLENYVPDGVKYSASDYHHIRPLHQVPRLSTRQFSAIDSHGIRRQISKFTVITNSAAPSRQGSRSTYVQSEAGETIRSYDPYRASRPHNLTADGVSKANVVVHRTIADRLHEDRMISRGFSSVASSKISGAHPSLMAARRYGAGTRSSLASSVHSRSRVGGSKAKTGLRYKRGVSFARIHGRSMAESDAGVKAPLKRISPRKQRSPARRASPSRDAYIRSKKAVDSVIRSGFSPRKSTRKSPRRSPRKGTEGQNQTFQEDVRHISRSLAKDCDMAFNFNMSALSTITSSLNDGSHARDSTPLTSFEQRDSSVIHHTPEACHSSTEKVRTSQRYDSRPLPPPPARSESVVKQLAAARQALEDRKSNGNTTHSPRHLNRMSNHIDRLMVMRDENDKRAVSAPAPAKKHDKAMPSAFRYSDQNATEDHALRQGSAQTAPEPRLLQTLLGRDSGPDGKRVTARAVPPSSPGFAAGDGWTSDKSSLGQSRQASPRTEYFTSDVPTHVAQDARGRESRQSFSERSGIHNDTMNKKKLNWFKRGVKGETPKVALQDVTNAGEKPALELKKKGFGLGGLFKNKKRAEKDDGEDVENPYALAPDNGFEDSNAEANDDEWEAYQRPGKGRDVASRQVEPRQTFLARLFRVKPAVDYICFNLSRRRARQEISAMMKQWRQFGISDVVTDKQRQMVFAKVGKKNKLNLKEVSFAIEVMAVIEHGRRGYLSIARFTQEAGAASSFHLVVKTVKETMGSRGYLVRDERKAKMMIKTLRSA